MDVRDDAEAVRASGGKLRGLRRFARGRGEWGLTDSHETRYGEALPGNRSNHGRSARFDYSPRMHHSDGLVSERTPEGHIRIGLTHGGDPFNRNTPVIWVYFTEETLASMMCHLARRGETGETFREALAFIQATGIEDENQQPGGSKPTP